MDNDKHQSPPHEAEKPAAGDASRRSGGAADSFLADLLTAECALGPAEAGAVLRCAENGKVDVLAVLPRLERDGEPPGWLRRAAELAHKASPDHVVSSALPGAASPDAKENGRYIVLLPLALPEMGPAAVAFLASPGDGTTLEAVKERLRLGAALTNLAGRRRDVQDDALNLQRLRKAMEVLATVNHHPRFGSAAMALCNEIASQWQCERVSLGLLKGKYVHARAMSHAEKFSRKMQVVQDIEAAMEECLDQDCEVLHPAPPEATYISRVAGDLAKRHGPSAIASFPVRHDGQARAVVTLERPADRPFAIGEIEAVRLALELCTPRLLALHAHDRWIGAKLADGVRGGLAMLIGPTHTWVRFAVLLVCGAIAFLALAQGPYRAEAPCILEGVERQVVPAPFDGYVKAVGVEVGDTVTAQETSLAELDTADLRWQLAGTKAEKAGHLKRAAAAMRDGETAEAQIAQADAEKAQAEIDLFNHMIEQARIVSPLSGTVVEGDLKRQIGAPVKKGDILFEVTPLDSLRAVLHVPEDRIVDVRVGQEGDLATASYPAQRIRFAVERIYPVAEVVKQRNVFKVQVRLLEVRPWMRPGMEGVAKIAIGRRPYAWIWTRRIVNWVRMELWL